MANQQLIRVALPVPLRSQFDYSINGDRPEIGSRVLVPFGQRQLVGVVTEHIEQSATDNDKLKKVEKVIDQQSIIPPSLYQLISSSASYYHHPIGECFATALPNLIAKGEPAELAPIVSYKLTEQGRSAISSISARATRILQAMTLLADAEQPLDQNQVRANEISSTTLKTLVEKGWVAKEVTEPTKTPMSPGTPLQLTSEQASALQHINNATGFAPFLLNGVTGSGKTEIYLQAIAKVIERSQQALVLIPEIGLTPQTLKRFEQRFPGAVGVIHSGLTDKQRLNTWLQAKAGVISVVIGTRSAVFTPLQSPGLIIIDEEHDLSFKQQDGFRYSSRDIALLRAKQHDIPIVIGSATPSLESINNVTTGKYQGLHLTQRANSAAMPTISLIDCKNQPMSEGFSLPLINGIKRHLDNGNQVLVFINRRGFAPVLMCHQCGHISECSRCDAYPTLHQSPLDNGNDYLQCHHCGKYQNKPTACSNCHSDQLVAIGQGTERVEKFLSQQFPNRTIQRIDRDTTRKKQAMNDYIKAAKSGETQILVGTQMIAKGHHFPNVSLVAIINIDGALFSSDFRAQERAAQLITQVAGRAGREKIQGEVLIQTHHPEHKLFTMLAANNYQKLAQQQLAERQQSMLPPFSFLAAFRAESHNKQQAADFLSFVALQFRAFDKLEVLGPVSSTISRKAGRYRFQLLLNSETRSDLHRALFQQLALIEASPLANKVRWSLDVDPQDLL
ncbi:MAG: primosomal protein N' [Kangiellaceae bacterium]|jgi:primosomal protein N' (replication factor Y)|nr:primosomal protein N' [Kangiellaceae bacterium]